MASLMARWEEGFRALQPGIRFSDRLKGTASAPFGLYEWVADLALMGRQIYPYEYYGVYRRSLLAPVEIAVATGSFDRPHESPALAVFVHRDNPLRQLTLPQLDRIFGAARTGGWQGLDWHTEVARTDRDDIRTWGQLGLTGAWANRPIHVYGPPGIYPGGVSFFQTRVFGGADSWNEGLREFPDRGAMMAALGADPDGIAYAGMDHATSAVRTLALAETAASPPVTLTRAHVADRSYPLTRTIYIYFAPDQPNGDPADPKVDPKVREFLRYVLSRQGQEAVALDGNYLPLTAALAAAQQEKLK
jgi:phosphate transport system substrate-binding protein